MPGEISSEEKAAREAAKSAAKEVVAAHFDKLWTDMTPNVPNASKDAEKLQNFSQQIYEPISNERRRRARLPDEPAPEEKTSYNVPLPGWRNR